MAKSLSFNASEGFNLTRPALVALIGYAILVVIVLLPVDMYRYDDKQGGYVRTKYSLPYRLLVVLLLLFPFLLSVYSVNCMVVGNCIAWSWIVSIITILWAALVAVLTFMTGAFSLDMLV